jgi:YXWGXW repeat-containing protein
MTRDGMRPDAKTRALATPFAILAVLAFASVFWASCAMAQISLDVIIGSPPPPVRVEVVPAPRPGYVWAPGYWAWNGRQHVWYDGRWEAERPDQRFVPAHWVDTPGGWRFVPAHWDHVEHERGGFCPPGQAKKGRC